jgi:hypothetical protein
MLADSVDSGVGLHPATGGLGRRIVGVRLVDHHAAARVDADVARKEYEVTGLLLTGGNLGQAGPRLLAVGGSRAKDILAVDEDVDPADETGTVQSVLPVVAVAVRMGLKTA